MIKHNSDLVLEITAHDPETVERDLNTAEAIARAMPESQHGILVTRHDSTTYTVAVGRDVPYGETQEWHAQTEPAQSAAPTKHGRDCPQFG